MKHHGIVLDTQGHTIRIGNAENTIPLNAPTERREVIALVKESISIPACSEMSVELEGQSDELAEGTTTPIWFEPVRQHCRITLEDFQLFHLRKIPRNPSKKNFSLVIPSNPFEHSKNFLFSRDYKGF